MNFSQRFEALTLLAGTAAAFVGCQECRTVSGQLASGQLALEGEHPGIVLQSPTTQPDIYNRITFQTSIVFVPGQPMASFDDCKACACFISAMAHHQLKETDQARAALKQGGDIVRTKLPSLDGKNLGPSWWSVLTTSIFRSEAGKTIGDSKPGP